MLEEKCGNCRHIQRKPCTYYDWCPVINESVREDQTIYDLCCDCFEEDI